ncbi:MAG: hypothetical protein U0163_12365 [Gemmatimonadaceae bacterium]
MNRLISGIAAVMLVAGVASAQSVPPIARTKLAATHAVNQTNAHTSRDDQRQRHGAASRRPGRQACDATR